MRFDVAPSNVDLAENVISELPMGGPLVAVVGVIFLESSVRTKHLWALNELLFAVERHADAPA
jgi:hypothetical protein